MCGNYRPRMPANGRIIKKYEQIIKPTNPTTKTNQPTAKSKTMTISRKTTTRSTPLKKTASMSTSKRPKSTTKITTLRFVGPTMGIEGTTPNLPTSSLRIQSTRKTSAIPTVMTTKRRTSVEYTGTIQRATTGRVSSLRITTASQQPTARSTTRQTVISRAETPIVNMSPTSAMLSDSIKRNSL